MTRPPTAERLSTRHIEALGAVLAGARTVPAVMTACGWKSKTSAWLALRRLAAAGLVSWEIGRAATLRPTVKVVDLTALNVESETMTMHTPLVLARADVRGTDGTTYTGVAIRVLDGEVHLADRSGADLGKKTGVTAVAPTPPGWAVQFDNGSIWEVERGGCGCGGSV